MELNTKPVEVESSGILEEESFGIADMGFILTLFRDSIYSDKVAAVCREISCNARDAHREVGKADVPIRITLPNALDPNYRIRDFGPGISEDRMKNVFIKYGASTKRDSNLQTGGFGIGAKTPFGYTDSFAIYTYRAGEKCSYSAIIDDSRRGKLSLLDRSPTNEPDGTEIVIPIQTKDFGRFNAQTHHATKHWDVKPEIRGGTIMYNDFPPEKVVLSGNNWFVAREGHGDRSTKLIIDGIEYPFNAGFIDEKILPRFGYGTTLYLKFSVGVITLSATRESVEYDDNTKRIVSNALKIVKNELQQKFEDSIKNASSYIAANLEAHKITSSLNIEFPDGLTWKGLKLHGKAVRFDYSQANATVYELTTRKGKEFASKLREANSTLEFTEDTVYCVNDIETCTEAAVRAVFKFNPGKKTVTIVKFIGNETEVLTKTGLDNINWIRVSNCYTPRKNVKSSLGRLTFYKWDEHASKFTRTSVDAYEKDANKKTFVRLSRDYDKSLHPLVLESRVQPSVISSFVSKFPGYSVYGFAEDIAEERIEEATEEMTTIEKIVEDYISANNLPLEEIAYANSTQDYALKPLLGHGMVKTITNGHRANFNTQDNALLQYADNHNSFVNRVNELKRHAFVLNFVPAGKRQPKDFRSDYKANQEDVLVVYPMLRYMDRHMYDYAAPDQIETLIQYVNTVDQCRNAP
jgi:hypothetical protein